MATSSIPVTMPIKKYKTTRVLMPGSMGITGTTAQYSNAEKRVILRLPFLIMTHPVKGIAPTAPIAEASSTRPIVPSSAPYSSCILGNRDTQFAKINPLTKKAILTARRRSSTIFFLLRYCSIDGKCQCANGTSVTAGKVVNFQEQPKRVYRLIFIRPHRKYTCSTSG
jgi:hypothetical protein